MPLDPPTLLALASACAPAIAPSTLLAVARAESGLDPLAIGVNGPRASRIVARTLPEAVAAAERLAAEGRNFDLGLAQINVRNLPWLGLSLEAAFDPCRNLAAAGAVLSRGYRQGVATAGPGQGALRIALSLYNTGHPARGFANGYVARVTGRADRPRPAAGNAEISPPAWDSFATARRAWSTAPFVLTAAGATP